MAQVWGEFSTWRLKTFRETSNLLMGTPSRHSKQFEKSIVRLPAIQTKLLQMFLLKNTLNWHPPAIQFSINEQIIPQREGIKTHKIPHTCTNSRKLSISVQKNMSKSIFAHRKCRIWECFWKSLKKVVFYSFSCHFFLKRKS